MTNKKHLAKYERNLLVSSKAEPKYQPNPDFAGKYKPVRSETNKNYEVTPNKELQKYLVSKAIQRDSSKKNVDYLPDSSIIGKLKYKIGRGKHGPEKGAIEKLVEKLNEEKPIKSWEIDESKKSSGFGGFGGSSGGGGGGAAGAGCGIILAYVPQNKQNKSSNYNG